MQDNQILTDLIARLEAASEGSRDLDAMIGLMTGDWKVQGRAIGVRKDDGAYRWVAFSSDGDFDYEGAIRVIRGCLSLKSYTTSLDAAMSLTNPEGYIRLERYSDGWYAVVRHKSTHSKNYDGLQKPAALGLCIALLKLQADT